MAVTVAFMGFRHPHIFGLYGYVQENKDFLTAASCEEDDQTRSKLQKEGKILLTHDSYEKMLEEADFSILLVGDYYSKRGAIVKRAIEAGKHVFCDKPLCTNLSDLEEIQRLADKTGRMVGLFTELRYHGNFIKVRELITNGEIGEVHSIFFGAQHPLILDTRPKWYGEEGKHGGTINDLIIHATDSLVWMTGKRFIRVDAARCWNAGIPHMPHFKNAAHVMLTMENNCGVLGDLTYMVPDSFGYKVPLYWRMTFWGEKGTIETGVNSPDVALYREGETEVRHIPPAESVSGGAINALVRRINGKERSSDASQQEIFEASRIGLKAQQAADQNLCRLTL
ncbi:MAG TPA: Gfo/Idh/MocA family oxidoreductase [Spirochaetia bacterium]|nr:Gfo/Idh/MocA family oxidoreductase [Spirochaetia bacterium]